MDGSPLQDATGRTATLPLVLRAIRRRRGLRSAEVAKAMGLPLRTFQHFESGRGGIDIDRIHRFAEVTDADGYAIMLALDIGSPDFAIHCLDNKAATVMLVALQRFDRGAGANIAKLDPRSIIAIFDRAFDDLTAKAREHEVVLESWMTDTSFTRAYAPPD